ncbi:unnamed protein product, partial [Rotaria sordida]
AISAWICLSNNDVDTTITNLNDNNNNNNNINKPTIDLL